MSKNPHADELKVLKNKVDQMWASVDSMGKMLEALVATINADRAEKFSDRVTMWKIDGMVSFMLQKSGSKLPLPEGAPEGTPQQVISWYDQFMPKWKKLMAEFQITNTEGGIPDEKVQPTAEKPEDLTASAAPLSPINPEDFGRPDAARDAGNGGTVQFPGASPDRPSASQKDGPEAGGEAG